MIVTTNQIADLFSITDRAVRKWSDKGCPRAGHGKWDLKLVLQWWLDNIYRSEDDGDELASAKLEYWQAKARNETVKADLSEGSVMAIHEFKVAWAWRVGEMSNGLGAIPMRTASLLVGKTEKEIKSILENEMWKIRDKFSRTGKFTPAVTPAKEKKKRGKKVK